jgi:hypothetical protein
LDRSNSSNIPVIFSNATDQLSLDTYYSVTNDQFLSSNYLAEFNQQANLTNGEYQIVIKPSNISTAGDGFMYAIANVTNGPNSYLDLTPDRYYFSVYNNPPYFNTTKSTFGGTAFASTQSGNYIITELIQTGQYYEAIMYVNDNEDPVQNLTVTCSLLPVYSYEGQVQEMIPNTIPQYQCVYDQTSKSYLSLVNIPTQMNWTTGNTSISISTNSESENYFFLLWFNVRDLDGGTGDFYIALLPLNSIPDLTNATPVIITFIILAVAVIILSIHRKKQITSQNPYIAMSDFR